VSPAHPSQRPPRGTHPLPLVPAQTPPRALTAVRPEPPRRARALKQPPAIGVLRAAKHVIERRSLDVFFILLLPVARPAASAASAAAAEPPRVRFTSRVVARLLLPAPSRALERQDVEIARDAPKGVARDGVAERARGASSRHGARGDEGPRRARPRGGGRSRAGGALAPIARRGRGSRRVSGGRRRGGGRVAEGGVEVRQERVEVVGRPAAREIGRRRGRRRGALRRRRRARGRGARGGRRASRLRGATRAHSRGREVAEQVVQVLVHRARGRLDETSTQRPRECNPARLMRCSPPVRRWTNRADRLAAFHVCRWAALLCFITTALKKNPKPDSFRLARTARQFPPAESNK